MVGGDKAFNQAGAVDVGAQIAFVTPGADAVVLQDKKTGAVTKRIAIGPPDANDFMVAGHGNRFVVVFGDKRAGDVAVVDVVTDKVVVHTAKRCP